MDEFLRDFAMRSARVRYIDASLPSLPFADDAFELALCSHFLFLYSEQHDSAFHAESIRELARVARQVRVFPLLELGSAPSRHLGAVVDELANLDLEPRIVRVPYEFQRGGNEILRIQGLSS